MIDLAKTQYASQFAGFRDSGLINHTISIASFNLDAGLMLTVVVPKTMNNVGDISETRVKFAPLEDFYRVINGYIFAEFPDPASPEYEIGVFTYYEGLSHTTYLYIVNETAGTVTIPALTVGVEVDLYDTPFGED